MSRAIVIVGGGHNGLTAAAYLARSGHRVTLVEAGDEVGGLVRGHAFHPGYQAPGVLPDTGHVRPRVVAELGLQRFGLAWREPAPVWVPVSIGPEDESDGGGDGSGIWIERDRVHGALGAPDIAAFAAYRAQIARIAAVARPILDSAPPDPHGKLWPLFKTGWRVKKLGPEDLAELLRIGPMPVGDWMAERFQSAHLRAALALPALDGAYMAPRSPGSAGNLLLHELTRGQEVVGGGRALIDALRQAALAQGVEIRTSARVTRIRLDTLGTRVTGLELDRDGGTETIEATHIAVSCDPKTAFLSLIGARHLPARLSADVRNIRARGIVAQVNLALSGPLENAAGELVEHARITGVPDDIERAFDCVKYGRFAERPALEIRVPSAGDPGLCERDGQHVACVRVFFAPGDVRGGWTDEQRDKLLEATLARAQEYLPGLRERIVARELLTPSDMEARYRVSGGHHCHGEHALDQLLFMRPTVQCSHYTTPIRGLYLCGSGSHPGGGLTCAPGALAAAAIEAESYSRATR